MKSSLGKNLLIFFLVFIGLAALLSLFNRPAGPTVKEIDTVAMINQINNGEIKGIVVKGDKINLTLKDDTAETLKKEPGENFSELLKNYNVDPEKLQGLSLEVQEDTGTNFWLNIIVPLALPILLIIGLIWFMSRQLRGANNQAMSFGQSKPREEGKDKKEKISFADVAGVKEAKEELKEIVDFLINPKKFLALGAKIPRGVLLMGSPGTGKTMLAKAVAGEAGVPFFSISGSEFVEMFVGVGASRVRDLFRRAKKASPCIIFIDEIDAVGRQRGAGLGGSHDEREQTLNQILVEMDGFESSVNVIVMAATNRPDVLDPALLRPGRFDRRVILDLPDIGDREEILKIHARNKVMEKDVDLRRVAERTPGFSGADLANILNEAAILAARRNKKKVSQVEALESIEKVMLGPERKSHILSTKEKKITAYHEAGHALLSHLLPNADPVHKVSIIARGRAAGYTLKLPNEERKLQTRSGFLDEIAVLLAGHETEKAIFGEVTTGASNDLERATQISRDLVTRYGMSDKLPPRTFGTHEEMIFLGREIHEQRDYSEKVAETIDQEIAKIITDNIKRVQAILQSDRDFLDEIARRLVEKETLEKEEFESIFKTVAK
ncbi:MAG: ATP-dependent zinc metalloprotease FtsH [Patescibacteria group bacterium]|jgi:cell division protease FtsH